MEEASSAILSEYRTVSRYVDSDKRFYQPNNSIESMVCVVAFATLVRDVKFEQSTEICGNEWVEKRQLTNIILIKTRTVSVSRLLRSRL